MEVHWLEQQHAFLRELLFDRRFVERFDDLVVEFGNAGYQDLVDRYLAGEDIAGGNVVQRLERLRPGSCVVVFTHYVFEDVAARRAAELERLERRLSRRPVPWLAGIQGAWLAGVDPVLLLGDPARITGPDGSVREVGAPPFLAEDGTPLEGVTLGDVADLYLYLGPVRGLTLRPPTQS